ncbi:MAG: hypothetical protein QW610_02670 [Pyrobaculum sp.]
MSLISQVRERLGVEWELVWRPPPPGVFLLKEEYLTKAEAVESICARGDTPVVYIVVYIGDVVVVYGRVKPAPAKCPVATFSKKFPVGKAREAVRALIDYALEVDKIPVFQLNPDVLRYADLCHLFPLVCDDPVEVISHVKKSREVSIRRPKGQAGDVFTLLVQVLKEKVDLDPAYLEIVKKVVEDPERLRACYV